MYSAIVCSLQPTVLTVVPASPEVLPREILLPSIIRPRNPDCAFPLDVPYGRRNAVLGRNADEHVDMVRHDMALDDFARLLVG